MKRKSLLKKLGHWHCKEAFERQEVAVDNIKIYMTINGSRINQPHVFEVSYRCFEPEHEGEPFSQQYWKAEFAIRNGSNPTQLGKMMGIKTRDKRISIFSPKGKAIQNFLHGLARSYAGGLSNNKQPIEDQTGYAN